MTGDPALADPPAPFDHASARARAEAFAVWRNARDGVRLRLGLLATGGAGTILLVPGRTEYLEKYGAVADRFAQAGYGMVSVDIRGQGLSDRALSDPRIGHVARFADYQHDMDALVAFAAARDMPKPWVVIGHSMGGAIALRALVDGLDVTGAVFSAPMWGIAMNPALRPVAWGLGWAAHRAGLNRWVTPGTKIDSYVRICDPNDNFLTDDPGEIAQMRAQLDAVPGLDLGGPSVPWLYRALVECADLQRNADPGVPSLTFLPERDEIVSKPAMRAMTARWRDAELVEVPQGRHETMMEIPARQQLFFDRTLAFLAARA
ncbi:alpha/beta fold hydrolase [Meridianimarinicoccus sp. RP-17]|uniref:alpha/beta fold hydrolase n=1 Tax=Meridianimarinicoccus zhengii TaxID=2056810 RepID=UPI000DAEC8B5|nr:alpha/beta hydrolase [Phycocomes zhengii]